MWGDRLGVRAEIRLGSVVSFSVYPLPASLALPYFFTCIIPFSSFSLLFFPLFFSINVCVLFKYGDIVMLTHMTSIHIRLAKLKEEEEERKRFLAAIRTPNKMLRIAKKAGVVGFGFTIEGGEDMDRLQPHVESMDPYGAAASAGLQVGDYIINVNGQSYKNAVLQKVRTAIRSAENTGQCALAVYRDFGGASQNGGGSSTSVNVPKGFDATVRRGAPSRRPISPSRPLTPRGSTEYWIRRTSESDSPVVFSNGVNAANSPVISSNATPETEADL